MKSALTLIFDSANVGDIATQATRNKLTLYVGSDSFNLGAGTLAGNQRTITWTGTSLSWSASDSITLKITDDSTPAPPGRIVGRDHLPLRQRLQRHRLAYRGDGDLQRGGRHHRHPAAGA